jgi:hypothetical protein
MKIRHRKTYPARLTTILHVFLPHSMALSPTVEKVLRQVEKTTGLPVHVEPDSTLPKNILAKVTMPEAGFLFIR